MPGFDPENAETYPAVEDCAVNSIGNALAAAQVFATLAVADELRRHNDRGDAFTVELLGLLDRITEDPQPGPDAQPADEEPPASKGFGYYAEDPSEACTARSHPDRRAWHRCLRLAGHEGLHENGFGAAFAQDVPAAPSQQEGEDG
jgi:hypothetical protein